ncbi:hypothetical protein ACWKWU_13865 [Chitinophaga lutea]
MPNCIRYTLLLLMIGLSMACTKKNTDTPTGDADGEMPPPVVKEKGEPAGAAVTQLIGPGGGSAASEDGNLQIDVPAGAISTPLTFTIQPITNTLDDAAARNGYRLGPEGTHFAKPVTLTFAYQDALHTEGSDDAQMIAFQRGDGVWCAMPTVLNKDAGTVSVTTTHFSDWIWFSDLTLRKDKPSAQAKEVVTLDLLEMGLLAPLSPNNGPQPGIDSVPLSTLEDFSAKDYTLGNWKIVSGPGKLVAGKNSHGLPGKALYTAPDVINTPETVTIQVEITGKGVLKDPSHPKGQRPVGKMIFLTEIKLLPDSYISGKFGGTAFNFPISGATMRGSTLVIKGTSGTTTPFDALTIYLYGASVKTYPGGGGAGQSEAGFTRTRGTGGTAYFSKYPNCTSMHYSGSATVTRIEGGFIEGSYEGYMYIADGRCGFIEVQTLTATFRVRME